MTTFALILVLTSAFIHAGWNLLAKRAAGGAAFVWLFTLMMTVLWAPLALIAVLVERPSIGAIELVFMLGTGILHIGYFLMLARGYRKGDLSLVYPLARGTGPMLATVAAITLLGERPTPLALAGVVSIGVGVFIFTGGLAKLTNPAARPAVGYALLTGTIIAAYTVWDKYAVDALMIPPLLYLWTTDAVRVVLLGALIRNRGEDVRHAWQHHRWEALGVAIMSPLAYLMVLTALTFSPVSYVAPVREVSILIGAAMGTILLSEGEVRRRWSAAAVMVAGVIALALG